MKAAKTRAAMYAELQAIYNDGETVGRNTPYGADRCDANFHYPFDKVRSTLWAAGYVAGHTERRNEVARYLATEGETPPRPTPPPPGPRFPNPGTHDEQTTARGKDR